MGRLKAFDEDQVLDRAVDCFWLRGYEATSVRDLADRMGIGGTSLYNAYGDKRALFIAALARYAERSMREAEEALRNGDPREASRAQRRALDNLQQGMGDMAEQMRQRGPGNGQDIAEIEERERRGEDRDPLGRSDGNFGDSVDTGVDKVPLELERQKSREILDELRRRAGEQQRPKEELDYIDRLLKTY